MFHVGTVLCEADADRRVYRWLADDPEIQFVACNGKGGIAAAANTLRQLGVPTAAIADFDVLVRDGELRSILRALDSEDNLLDDGQVRYSEIRQALSSVRDISMEDLYSEIQDIINKAKAASPDRSKFLKDLQAKMASAKSGYEVKRYGIDKLSGELHVACKMLLTKLAATGLFVVPIGELESWWRGGPPDKNAWIIKAREQADSDPHLFAAARDFVATVRTYLRSNGTWPP